MAKDKKNQNGLLRADVGLASVLGALAQDSGMLEDFRQKGFSADLQTPTSRNMRENDGMEFAVMCADSGNLDTLESALSDMDIENTPVEPGKAQSADSFFRVFAHCALSPVSMAEQTKLCCGYAMEHSRQPKELLVCVWNDARRKGAPAGALLSAFREGGAEDELARASAALLSRKAESLGARLLLEDLETFMGSESMRESMVWTHRIAKSKQSRGLGKPGQLAPMGACIWEIVRSAAGQAKKQNQQPYWGQAAAQPAPGPAPEQRERDDLLARALSFVRQDLIRNGILDEDDLGKIGKLAGQLPEECQGVVSAAFERKSLDALLDAAMEPGEGAGEAAGPSAPRKRKGL